MKNTPYSEEISILARGTRIEAFLKANTLKKSTNITMRRTETFGSARENNFYAPVIRKTQKLRKHHTNIEFNEKH